MLARLSTMFAKYTCDACLRSVKCFEFQLISLRQPNKNFDTMVDKCLGEANGRHLFPNLICVEPSTECDLDIAKLRRAFHKPVHVVHCRELVIDAETVHPTWIVLTECMPVSLRVTDQLDSDNVERLK